MLGADGPGLDSDIIEGVVWAADHGADVILMSFSNPGFSPALQAAIDYAWEQGAVIVAATGNDGVSTPTFPAGDAKVVGVSATDQTDELWSGLELRRRHVHRRPRRRHQADAPTAAPDDHRHLGLGRTRRRRGGAAEGERPDAPRTASSVGRLARERGPRGHGRSRPATAA